MCVFLRVYVCVCVCVCVCSRAHFSAPTQARKVLVTNAECVCTPGITNPASAAARGRQRPSRMHTYVYVYIMYTYVYVYVYAGAALAAGACCLKPLESVSTSKSLSAMLSFVRQLVAPVP